MKAILKKAVKHMRATVEGIRGFFGSYGYAPGGQLYGRVPKFVLVRPMERPLGRKRYY